LEYQVLFLEFKFPKALPIKGWRIKNMKKIILPIILLYKDLKKLKYKIVILSPKIQTITNE